MRRLNETRDASTARDARSLLLVYGGLRRPGGGGFRPERADAATSQLLDRKLETDLVPGPVEFYVLLPPGYSETGERYPLVIDLHGGGGSRANLERQRPLFDGLWKAGRMAPMVIAMPSVTPRCFYMDFRDGKEKWESFLVGPFLDHLRATYHVRADQRGTLVTGISMGGMGSLRLAFKYPDRFGAVAGMEPGIEPILQWKEMRRSTASGDRTS